MGPRLRGLHKVLLEILRVPGIIGAVDRDDGDIGGATPSSGAAMAGSFHVVIFWSKILAITSADMFTVSMPSRLNAMAMGEI